MRRPSPEWKKYEEKIIAVWKFFVAWEQKKNYYACACCSWLFFTDVEIIGTLLVSFDEWLLSGSCAQAQLEFTFIAYFVDWAVSVDQSSWIIYSITIDGSGTFVAIDVYKLCVFVVTAIMLYDPKARNQQVLRLLLWSHITEFFSAAQRFFLNKKTPHLFPSFL